MTTTDTNAGMIQRALLIGGIGLVLLGLGWAAGHWPSMAVGLVGLGVAAAMLVGFWRPQS